MKASETGKFNADKSIEWNPITTAIIHSQINYMSVLIQSVTINENDLLSKLRQRPAVINATKTVVA